ncbi:MAG: GntR family transcriptional regulator [Desulfocapsaceae bacterium]|nr:GntR family transcriptional regulator [Desulfocapsaceae bacterium]
MSPLTPRTTNLAGQVEEIVREKIISGEIPLGSRISELKIADQIGISKSPVRQALFRLQEEHLVTILPQKGTFVFTPDEKQLRNVCLLRSILEPAALKVAFENNRDLLLAELKKQYFLMKESVEREDYVEYAQHDMQFHDVFFELSDNPFFTESYKLIRSLLSVLRIQLKSSSEHLSKSFAEHSRIIEELEKPDMESALFILDRHIGLNENSYWSNITTIVENMAKEKKTR